MAKKEGDRQARAELLAQLLISAEIKTFLMQYGRGREERHIVVLIADKENMAQMKAELGYEPEVFSIGKGEYTSLPLEDKKKYGSLPEMIFSSKDGKFNESFALIPQ